MNKPLKFQPSNNDSTTLPKSMVKGKLEGEQFTEVDRFKIDNELSLMTSKDIDNLKRFLILEQYKDLTENKYIVNEDVDEIYLQIADFFISHGAVEITDRTPRGDDTLQVNFEVEQPFTITDGDMDMFEKVAFIYGNGFRLFCMNGKLIVQFTLRGYYNKQKIEK